MNDLKDIPWHLDCSHCSREMIRCECGSRASEVYQKLLEIESDSKRPKGTRGEATNLRCDLQAAMDTATRIYAAGKHEPYPAGAYQPPKGWTPKGYAHAIVANRVRAGLSFLKGR